jgi:hypothetical protein
MSLLCRECRQTLDPATSQALLTLWLANTRAVFFGSRPRHYYGAWTR